MTEGGYTVYSLRTTGCEIWARGAQQMAEFPLPQEGEPWHGYPIWAVNGLAPENRRGEKMRPDKDVFLKMQRAGLLTERERKRLFKGDHA